MKVSKLILVVFFLSLFVNMKAQEVQEEKGIKFNHDNWASIVSTAKATNKLIFLDAFASWCGPCKWMAKNVFTNDTVAEFFKKNFVCAKIDMEKGEGIEIAKKFGVRAYPTFMFIDGNEQLVHRICGSMPAANFIKQAEDALNPEKQLLTFKKKFESGKPDAQSALSYFSLLRDACMGMDQEVASYLKTQKEKELTSKDNWNIMEAFLTDANSREFKYIIKQKKDFAKLYTAEKVNAKIKEVYSAGLINAVRKNDTKTYESLIKAVKKMGNPEAGSIIAAAELRKFASKKDWKNYVKTADQYFGKYGKNEYMAMNESAWAVYKNSEDKTDLEKAAKWAKKSIELKSSYANCDTYASLLYKLGKKTEAAAAAEKAIEEAKREGADYQETVELQKKIQALQ
ncbi:MAG: thioredoxin family protein [Methanococcaceae archaeon]